MSLVDCLKQTFPKGTFCKTSFDFGSVKRKNTKQHNSDKKRSKPTLKTLKLSRILEHSIERQKQKVTFGAMKKQKNKTICGCQERPLASSLYEILDLFTFVFNIQISLLEIDQIGENLSKYYFGSADARLKFYMLKTFRSGPKLAALKAKLQKLLEKLRRKSASPDEDRIRLVEDRLRRVEDVFGDFRNFSFRKLVVSGSQKRRMMSQTVADCTTQSTIKTIGIFSSLEKVRKGGVRDLSHKK